jgi:hypothetical protein
MWQIKSGSIAEPGSGPSRMGIYVGISPFKFISNDELLFDLCLDLFLRHAAIAVRCLSYGLSYLFDLCLGRCWSESVAKSGSWSNDCVVLEAGSTRFMCGTAAVGLLCVLDFVIRKPKCLYMPTLRLRSM